MSVAAILHEAEDDLLPVAPTAEQWRALTPAAQRAFLLEAAEAAQRAFELMGEGNPHAIARFRVRQLLGDYFDRVGARVFLASEMTVHYPAERVICPDLIAVREVEHRGDEDERMAWVVAEEGQGIDLAMEILHAGDAHKDLVRNVKVYARLGIREYFIYDRRRFVVQGFRLPSRGPARYEPIASRAGHVYSEVLGLSLAVVDRRLRFYERGGGEVPETTDLLERASRMVRALEDKAGLAEAAVAEAQAEAQAALEARLAAEAQTASAEAARVALETRLVHAEDARADAEQARAAAEARVAALEAQIAALEAAARRGQ